MRKIYLILISAFLFLTACEAGTTRENRLLLIRQIRQIPLQDRVEKMATAVAVAADDRKIKCRPDSASFARSNRQ